MKQTEILTHATHVNGWEPAVYMSCMSQNFRLFHVSNLSVRNFRIFLLMYPGSVFAQYQSAFRRSSDRPSWATCLWAQASPHPHPLTQAGPATRIPTQQLGHVHAHGSMESPRAAAPAQSGGPPPTDATDATVAGRRRRRLGGGGVGGGWKGRQTTAEVRCHRVIPR